MADPLRQPDADQDARAGDVAARAAGRRRRLWTLLALGLITAVGAALRFYELDQPALWGDEVATYGRIGGTFEKLMDILDEQGFVPLHYIAYWALGKVMHLDPWAMRLIPAVAGTLFVPAAWFLARQMLDRRTALLAAAFAAVSAWALTYSRDAKMYMHTWLFVTLMVGLLLHWLATKRWWSYLLLIPAGGIAVMLHATALTVVALLPVFLISPPGRLRKRDPVYFLLAIALILAGPAWYYLGYNKYIARTGIVPASTAHDQDEEIRTRWGNSGLGWVEDYNRGIDGWENVLNSATGYLVGLQWPREQIDPKPFDRELRPWFSPAVTGAMSMILGLLALGAVPWPRRWRGKPVAAGDADLPRPPPGERRDAQPWPRVLLWLAIWLIVPTYGVYYCRSYENFASPADWLAAVWGWLGMWWLAAVPAGALVWLAIRNQPRRAGLAAALLGTGLLGSAAVAGALAGTDWLLQWANWLSPAWAGGPIVAVGLALLWRQAGETLRQRLRNTLRLALVLGVLLGICFALYYVWQHLWEQHKAEHPDEPWVSIWMPRYLGIVFPAVVVAVAALLSRLPTRPVRWLAIAIVLGLNLTQGLARIVVDTEPPWDEVAADVWTAHNDPQTLTAVAIRAGRDYPGDRYDWFAPRRHSYYGSLRGWYYLLAVAGETADPEAFRVGEIRDRIGYAAGRLPIQLAAQVQRETPSRLIVWERFDSHVPKHGDAGPGDPVLDALGADWRRVEEHTHQSRQFWTWRHGSWYRRHVYEAVPPTSTEPEQTIPPSGANGGP